MMLCLQIDETFSYKGIKQSSFLFVLIYSISINLKSSALTEKCSILVFAGSTPVILEPEVPTGPMASAVALCSARWPHAISFTTKKPATQHNVSRNVSVRAVMQPEGEYENPALLDAHANYNDAIDFCSDTDRVLPFHKTTRRAAMGMAVTAAIASVHVLPNGLDGALAETDVVDSGSGSKAQFMDSE